MRMEIYSSKKTDDMYIKKIYRYLDTYEAKNKIYNRIYKFIKKYGVTSVLDVGCNHGNLAEQFATNDSIHRKYVGFDNSNLAIMAAKKKFCYMGNMIFDICSVSDAEKISRKYGKFDGIYLGGILFYFKTLDEKREFIDIYTNLFQCPYIFIQDLKISNIKELSKFYKFLEYEEDYLNIDNLDNERRERVFAVLQVRNQNN